MDLKWLKSVDVLQYTPIVPDVSDSDREDALSSGNANWIMDNWFKKYRADVFISHAHGDEGLAKRVATFFTTIGLKVFIDSDVWEHVKKLQREIDDDNAVSSKDSAGKPELYDYGKRNVTTSHVHVLLFHALMRMIAETECFLFLSTPNSAIKCSPQSIETYSPWLFHEIEVANKVERQKLERRHKGNFSASTMLKESQEGLKWNFKSSVGRLRPLTLEHLVNTKNRYVAEGRSTSTDLLDMLYVDQ